MTATNKTEVRTLALGDFAQLMMSKNPKIKEVALEKGSVTFTAGKLRNVPICQDFLTGISDDVVLLSINPVRDRDGNLDSDSNGEIKFGHNGLQIFRSRETQQTTIFDALLNDVSSEFTIDEWSINGRLGNASLSTGNDGFQISATVHPTKLVASSGRKTGKNSIDPLLLQFTPVGAVLPSLLPVGSTWEILGQENLPPDEGSERDWELEIVRLEGDLGERTVILTGALRRYIKQYGEARFTVVGKTEGKKDDIIIEPENDFDFDSLL